ncbi:unnamed protein product [Acidithrix sp. C25]|nr:unnamed protein product [Acidithrix sp. C25]
MIWHQRKSVRQFCLCLDIDLTLHGTTDRKSINSMVHKLA